MRKWVDPFSSDLHQGQPSLGGIGPDLRQMPHRADLGVGR